MEILKRVTVLFIGNMLLPLIAIVLFHGGEVIAGIFKTGVWLGVFLVTLVLAIIGFLISRTYRK